MSYQRLSQALWGIDEGDLNSLRTHVYSLRKLLSAEFGRGLSPVHIMAVAIRLIPNWLTK